MKLKWDERAWDEYLVWERENKKILQKINTLIKDIQRNGYKGIGSPEPLSQDKSGWWSRKIDDKNRIVYKIYDDSVVIASCRGHYDDK